MTSKDIRTTGAQPWVADLYDAYVTTEVDIPFFLEEALAVKGPVLELMAGTGRVSLPLAEAGVPLTCVDLSGPMLERLRTKLAARGVAAEAVEADVARLALSRRDFALAVLPFQSFAELPTPEDQTAALAGVAAHLRPGGRFICTMHNPHRRQQSVDGQLRLLGDFPLQDRDGTLLLWSLQRPVADTAVVQAMQFYELYDATGLLVEKRLLEARFRLVEQDAFRALAEAAGFRVAALYGDYARAAFDAKTSPFMIWVLDR